MMLPSSRNHSQAMHPVVEHLTARSHAPVLVELLVRCGLCHPTMFAEAGASSSLTQARTTVGVRAEFSVKSRVSDCHREDSS